MATSMPTAPSEKYVPVQIVVVVAPLRPASSLEAKGVDARISALVNTISGTTRLRRCAPSADVAMTAKEHATPPMIKNAEGATQMLISRIDEATLPNPSSVNHEGALVEAKVPPEASSRARQPPGLVKAKA
ncbi:Uncharacterised protein [Chlamydia trachomatis]|nr:Uncharacterised protein [Chlamydia trachomatis]